MSVHYEENIVKIQKSKMEIKTIKDIEEVRKKLAEYIYINNDANNKYESILKIFDHFSMMIFYISMICAFIYSLYLNIGAIILIWTIELIFISTIFCVSNKLHSNKKNIIYDFFDYYKESAVYNASLGLRPKIKFVVPYESEKSIIEINLPYFFYNFECILKMSDSNKCIEILAKSESKRETREEDILNNYVIKKVFENPIEYIDTEKLIFLKSNGKWRAFNTKTNKIEKDNCEIIELEIDEEQYYKQPSKNSKIKISEMACNNIMIIQ